MCRYGSQDRGDVVVDHPWGRSLVQKKFTGLPLCPGLATRTAVATTLGRSAEIGQTGPAGWNHLTSRRRVRIVPMNRDHDAKIPDQGHE